MVSGEPGPLVQGQTCLLGAAQHRASMAQQAKNFVVFMVFALKMMVFSRLRAAGEPPLGLAVYLA